MERRKGLVAKLVGLLSSQSKAKGKPARKPDPAPLLRPATPARILQIQIPDCMPDDWPITFEPATRQQVIQAAINGLSHAKQETDFLSSLGDQAGSLKALDETAPEHAEEIAWQFFRGDARRVWEHNAEQYRDWQKSIRDDLFDGTEKVVWSSARDDHRCSVCRHMHGQSVALGQPFKLPDGRPILFPPACGFSHSAGTGCRCRLDLDA